MKFSVKFADEKQLLKFHEICRDGQCVSFHVKFHTALWALVTWVGELCALWALPAGDLLG